MRLGHWSVIWISAVQLFRASAEGPSVPSLSTLHLDTELQGCSTQSICCIPSFLCVSLCAKLHTRLFAAELHQDW